MFSLLPDHQTLATKSQLCDHVGYFRMCLPFRKCQAKAWQTDLCLKYSCYFNLVLDIVCIQGEGENLLCGKKVRNAVIFFFFNLQGLVHTRCPINVRQINHVFADVK